MALLVGLPDGEEAVDVAVVAGGPREERLDAEPGDHRLDALRVGERRGQPGPHGVAVAQVEVDGVERERRLGLQPRRAWPRWGPTASARTRLRAVLA